MAHDDPEAWKRAVEHARQQIAFHADRTARYKARAISAEARLAELEQRPVAVWAADHDDPPTRSNW